MIDKAKMLEMAEDIKDTIQEKQEQTVFDYKVYSICCQVQALLKEQGWNMLTEDDDGIIHGLPGDDGRYLMTDGIDIWIDDYVDGVEDGIILDSGRDIREIAAWMYMSELPKKEGQ